MATSQNPHPVSPAASPPLAAPLSEPTWRIEPGLLRVFRWFVWGRLVLVLFSFCGSASPESVAADPGRTLQYPFPALVETVFLVVWLYSPWLQGKLRRAYLPVALVVATTGPLLELGYAALRRLAANPLVGTAASADAWLVIAALCVPLVLTAWQYGGKGTLLFVTGTTLLDLAVGLSLVALGGAAGQSVFGLAAIRGIVFLLVGYVIARLVAAQRVQRAELARLASTMEQLAISHERNRMARELHDTLAHTLSAVSVQLEALNALWDRDPGQARATLAQAQTLTRDGLHDVRRALHGLRSQPLQDLGLALAVRRLTVTAAARAGLTPHLHVSDDLPPLPPEIEQAAYRIAEEAITNVTRHANAQNLGVRLAAPDGMLHLEIRDDGRGFDLALRPEEDDSGAYHFGIIGMRERAALCGGSLIVSSAPGQGTQVAFMVSLDRQDRHS